jgi:hypothetical protein
MQLVLLGLAEQRGSPFTGQHGDPAVAARAKCHERDSQ